MILENGVARVVVDLEHGARLASLVVAGEELLVTAGTGPFDWGCFPMAPFAGRVRRGVFSFRGEEYRLARNLGLHAIHGTVFDAPFETDGPGVVSAPLGARWPFAGRVVQRLALDDHGLALTLEVHGDEPMPASCGWHPWWRRPVRLDFHAAWMYERDAEGIPTGVLVDPPPGPWDDCFTGLDGPPVLRWPSGVGLRVESDCPDVVVYDEPAHALCVEPQTAPPDALNLGAAVVEPGAPLVASLRLAWELPGDQDLRP